MSKKLIDIVEKTSAEIINPEKKVGNPNGGTPPKQTQFRKGNDAQSNGNYKHSATAGEQQQKPVVIKSQKTKPVKVEKPDPKNVKVQFNPKLQEAKGGTAVFTFGRMNPPTIGHQKLVDKVIREAGRDAMPHVYLSHSEGPKDPLPYNYKIKIAKKAFGNAVTESRARNIIQILQELQRMGHDKVKMVVGSDRVREFDKMLTKYNGRDFNFEEVSVVSAGQRDPDAEGVAGMSASKLRAAAKEGDLRTLQRGLPTRIKNEAKTIMGHIKEEFEIEDLNILEEEIEEALAELDDDIEELEERVLSMQQRRKLGLRMKRLAPRMKRARLMRKKRMATQQMLHKRAMRAARNIIRKRVAGGQKGASYSTLSISQKIMIDKRVEQKKNIIAKIAKRMMPKMKSAELERLRAARGGVKKESIDDLFGTFITEDPILKRMKDDHKRDKDQLAIQHKREKERHKIKKSRMAIRSAPASTNEELYLIMDMVDEITEQVQSLSDKVDQPIDDVFEKYMEGYMNPHGEQTPEQSGYFNVIREQKPSGKASKPYSSHGIPKDATKAELKAIRSNPNSSKGKKQLAHWKLNMHKEAVNDKDTAGLKKLSKKLKGSAAAHLDQKKELDKLIQNENMNIKKALQKVKGLSRQQAQLIASLPTPVLTTMVNNLSTLVMGESVETKNEQLFEVLIEKSIPNNPSLWSKFKAQAKAKFDVYPSAYANGWAAKKYKAAGGTWKSGD